MSSKKIAYASPVAITNAIESLGTSATWVAGHESATVDNGTNLYLDYSLSGKVTVGTTPTVGEIRIYIVGVMNDVYPDVFEGTTSAETVSSAGVRDGFAKLAVVLNVDTTTSNREYPFYVGSIAALSGGVCPKKWFVFTTHNTVASLNSTGSNQVFTQQGVYSTDA